MRPKQLPARIARWFVGLLAAATIVLLAVFAGIRIVIAALTAERWLSITTFAVLVGIVGVISALPERVRSVVLSPWNLINAAVAELIYYILVAFFFVRRWRVWVASLLVATAPIAFWAVHSTLERHSRAILLKQLLIDTAEVVDEVAIAPGHEPALAELQLRFRALAPQSEVEYPTFPSLLAAIEILSSRELDVKLEHGCEVCFPAILEDAIDTLPQVTSGPWTPDRQLVALLKTKLHMALSLRGLYMHHVFDAYETLEPLRSYVDDSATVSKASLEGTVRGPLDNLWAELLAMCAGNHHEYASWCHATQRHARTQEELFSAARLYHDSAFLMGSGLSRACAANNRVDLELRHLWLGTAQKQELQISEAESCSSSRRESRLVLV